MKLIRHSNIIILSRDKRDNILTTPERETFEIDSINGDGQTIVGGNGCLFKVISSNDGGEYALKVSRYSYELAEENKKIEKRVKRFEREIEAMSVSSTNFLEHVVPFYSSGNITIDGKRFPYFIMELCEFHLGDLVAARKEILDDGERLRISALIVRGIKSLNEFDIYHRDIKHENILFLDDLPYIADLGLSDYRPTDIDIDELGEKIGPIGWLSPEATNKYLTEKTSYVGDYDCVIDSKSDVFQLGKLIWFLFQGNLPLGQISETDFISDEKDIYHIVKDALAHNKENRLSIDDMLDRLEALFPKYFLS
nr:protein kinase family protein [uncultured Psychroserpens sp.]